MLSTVFLDPASLVGGRPALCWHCFVNGLHALILHEHYSVKTF